MNSLAADVEEVEDAELTPNTEVRLEHGKSWGNPPSGNFEILECAEMLKGVGGELVNFGCALLS